MAGDWLMAHSHGDAGVFHSTNPFPRRSATFHTVERPTLALGSAQPDRDVDERVARALRVDVVRRRSGGGAVLLIPGEFLWLDLVLPADDALWLADVAQAMVWVGELWQRALAASGVAGEVHREGLITTPWSRQVCFAGVGTGEVMAGGSKLVGISQRRTREFARFQSMCHLRWRPELAAALVAAPRPSAAMLAAVTRPVGVDGDVLSASLQAVLPTL
ncbi:MAG TPA: hypothetical protein PK020_11440 [Ilumatobacteraceae bacterium]|nr:hypothetical protein [Ilumatobacteraceae bacterium]HRB03233.1 hypothetical protein [Ilumatobacteraceae bacterium]